MMWFTSMMKVFIPVAIIFSEFGNTAEVQGGILQSKKFRRARGRRLVTSDPALTLGTTSRPPQCLALCSSHPSCVSVNYHGNEGRCLGYNSSLGLNGNYLVPDPQYDFYSSWPLDVTQGKWVLVFRAQRDINKSVGEAYLEAGVWRDEELLTLDPLYYSLDVQGVPDFHYRSRHLDLWGSSDIRLVSLGLYKNGSLVKDMIFDATNSNSTDWFSADRLLVSPWPDLVNNTTQAFSFASSTFLPRRFSVLKSETVASLCEQTEGWLLVTDGKTNYCPFEKTRVFPRFQYAEGPHVVDFSTEYQQDDYGMMDYADVLVIFVLMG